MKWFLVACAFCLVTASAVADNMVRLMDTNGLDVAEPQTITTDEVPASTPTPHIKGQGSTDDRTRLVKTLFKDYSKLVNPDNITLKVGVMLTDFKVVESNEALESRVWMQYEWEDSRLKWNPEEYGDAELIRLAPSQVWKPDVTLYNSKDPENMMNCWDSNVLIYNSGKILWVPPCKLNSICDYDLNVHPYGEQTCTFKFGSWTFDGLILDLQFYNDIAAMQTDYLINSSGFDVVSSTAERHVKTYPGVEEPYPDLTYNITIKRRPGEELIKKF